MRREPDASEPKQVQVRFPAERRYVAALRALATALAVQCELTVDEIEDLQMAVDEACALLLPHALPSERLSARFGLDEGSMEVTVSVPAAAHATPDRSGLPWMALCAFADRVDVESGDGALTIEISKHRATSLQ